jgi:hypothetical protein
LVETLHPGSGLAETEANGVLVGRVTCSLVVLAVADSVGTEKTSFPKPPGVASGEETSTCAEAGNAETSTKPPAAASAIGARPGARVLRRDMMDRKDMWDLSPRE